MTTTVTERETITKKETITITVTKNSSVETTTPSKKCSGKWAQCGGIGYKGPSCCQPGLTCHKFDKYYSQCILKF
ncbi:carbohydrate-binding module family 1 protein [Piromyces sp. E2]|nr:carbohydrate-binding module family 1 protein [Piromyces sp. E2]|eukprot:OUM64800.1 carbohydrate-binding module family 1 protein [Piromyces sp. E2]